MDVGISRPKLKERAEKEVRALQEELEDTVEKVEKVEKVATKESKTVKETTKAQPAILAAQEPAETQEAIPPSLALQLK